MSSLRLKCLNTSRYEANAFRSVSARSTGIGELLGSSFVVSFLHPGLRLKHPPGPGLVSMDFIERLYPVSSLKRKQDLAMRSILAGLTRSEPSPGTRRIAGASPGCGI